MAIFAINITKSGTGTGTVTSDIGGINCGATCNGGALSGSTVILTAVPDPGSVFVRWTGDLISTSNPASFTLNNNPEQINAEFKNKSRSAGVGSMPPYIYVAIAQPQGFPGQTRMPAAPAPPVPSNPAGNSNSGSGANCNVDVSNMNIQPYIKYRGFIYVYDTIVCSNLNNFAPDQIPHLRYKLNNNNQRGASAIIYPEVVR